MGNGKFSLRTIRSYLITLAVAVVALRIVLWAVVPFIPYIISGVVLLTVLGVAIHRTTKL